MNVLSISSDRKLFAPGSAVRSRTLEYGRLVDELHVIVFAKRSLGFRDEPFPPNIFLYPTNAHTRWGYVFRAIVQARKLKRLGVHIDVVTTQDPFEAGLAGFFIARLLGAKLHVQIHTDFMSPYFAKESFANRVRVMIAKLLLPQADAIRVVSKRIAHSLKSKSLKLKADPFVLPIFVDATTPHDVSHDGMLKKKYPQYDFHIVMASRLSPEKNIPLALEAMKEVVANHPRVGLIIVGGGSEEEYLKKLTQKLGLEQSVIFEGWQDDLSPYCHTADAFLLTSNYEGYGMAVVEALSAGCPVVMADVGVAGEVVHNGENGLVVPVGDRDALVRAITRVVTGGVKFNVAMPKLPTKEEYLAAYRASWMDAFR
ncbi:MAG: glycosyltransferase family 4 protein [Minisyncoccota bacterium]